MVRFDGSRRTSRTRGSGSRGSGRVGSDDKRDEDAQCGLTERDFLNRKVRESDGPAPKTHAIDESIEAAFFRQVETELHGVCIVTRACGSGVICQIGTEARDRRLYISENCW